MNMHDPDHRFDAAMRDTWHDAAAHLPGALRLKLAPAIAAQRRTTTRPARAWWLPAAGAFASVALAMGLWLSPAGRLAVPAAGDRAAQAAGTAVASTAQAEDVGDLLTRNPDFYAWLGSDEVRSLAME